MKTTVRLALVLVALAAFAATSHAGTLTFDGLTAANAEDITTNNQGYGGLTWNGGNNWTLFKGSVYGVPVRSGEYGVVNNRGLDPNIVSGTDFHFHGVWAVGWAFGAPSQIGIRAYDSSNTLIGDTGFVGINQTAYTWIAADFWGVQRLEFYGGQFFALDDMKISVPEPASLALLGIGIGALGFAAVRRRRNAN